MGQAVQSDAVQTLAVLRFHIRDGHHPFDVRRLAHFDFKVVQTVLPFQEYRSIGAGGKSRRGRYVQPAPEEAKDFFGRVNHFHRRSNRTGVVPIVVQPANGL